LKHPLASLRMVNKLKKKGESQMKVSTYKNISRLISSIFVVPLVFSTLIFAQKEKSKEAKWELKIGGYGQVQYEITTDTGSKKFENQLDNLKIRRFRLTFDGKLAEEKLFYRAYFDLEKIAHPRVREAYLGYEFGGPAKLKLTIGQHLVPFSADHLISSSKRLIAERSKVTSQLAPGRDIGGLQDRDIGITFAGKYFVDFWVGIFQGGAEINNGKFEGSEVEKVDNRKDIALRLLYKDLLVKGLDVGISYYNGAISTATVSTAQGGPIEPLSRNRFGVEILFTKNDISI